MGIINILSRETENFHLSRYVLDFFFLRLNLQSHFPYDPSSPSPRSNSKDGTSVPIVRFTHTKSRIYNLTYHLYVCTYIYISCSVKCKSRTPYRLFAFHFGNVGDFRVDGTFLLPLGWNPSIPHTLLSRLRFWFSDKRATFAIYRTSELNPAKLHSFS